MVLRFAISFSTPDGLVDSKSLGGSDGLAIGKVDRRVDCSSDGAIDGATTVYGAMFGKLDGPSIGNVDGRVDGPSDGKID